MYFEDVQLGEEYTSPGRTVTEADIVIFAGLSGDYNVLPGVLALRAGGSYESDGQDVEYLGVLNYMLQRTLSEGTAKKAQFDWPAAGKTGTSQSFRDAWFIGYTAHLTTGVWLGNDDNTPTKKVTGGSLPSLAWKEFMTGAHEGLPQTELPGRWQPSQPMPQDDFVPPAEVGKAEQIQPDPVAELIGKAAMPKQKPSRELTGSTKRPVPPADVGPSKKKQKSEPKTVLDVILGE